MPLVLFSGGCDSTLVLHDVGLRTSCEVIDVLSVCHDQVGAEEPQTNARQIIVQQLTERSYPLKCGVVKISQEGALVTTEGLPQISLWFVIAALYVKDGHTVYTGYHRGDDFWHFKYEAETAFFNLCKVLGKSSVKIEHPLEWVEKSQIISRLQKCGLYQYCWYCEASNSAPCGTCQSCVTHQHGLADLDRENKLLIMPIISFVDPVPQSVDSVKLCIS